MPVTQPKKFFTAPVMRTCMCALSLGRLRMEPASSATRETPTDAPKDSRSATGSFSATKGASSPAQRLRDAHLAGHVQPGAEVAESPTMGRAPRSST